MAKLFLAGTLPLFLPRRPRKGCGGRTPGMGEFPWSGAVRVKRAIDKSSEGKRAALPGSYRTYSPFAAYPTDDLIYTSVLITIDFSPGAGETRPLYRGRTDVASLSRTYAVSLFPFHSCAGESLLHTCMDKRDMPVIFGVRQASEKFINHFLNIETSARLISRL